MRISEVSVRSGVPTSTLRYYDSIGLISARRDPNGYRAYDVSVLEKLALVREAQALDLTLPEIEDLLTAVDADNCTQVRDLLHPQLQQRLREVDERLAALHELRTKLSDATRRVGACPDHDAPCRSECMAMGSVTGR